MGVPTKLKTVSLTKVRSETGHHSRRVDACEQGVFPRTIDDLHRNFADIGFALIGGGLKIGDVVIDEAVVDACSPVVHVAGDLAGHVVDAPSGGLVKACRAESQQSAAGTAEEATISSAGACLAAHDGVVPGKVVHADPDSPWNVEPGEGSGNAGRVVEGVKAPVTVQKAVCRRIVAGTCGDAVVVPAEQGGWGMRGHQDRMLEVAAGVTLHPVAELNGFLGDGRQGRRPDGQDQRVRRREVDST
jgi:hypothetical protein